MSDQTEAKLPKWAQERLRLLRAAKDRAERKLAEHLETVEETPIWYGNYENPIYVPKHYGHQRVYFNLGQPGSGSMYDEINVGIQQDKKSLIVVGSHSLIIEPNVTNEFVLRFRD